MDIEQIITLLVSVLVALIGTLGNVWIALIKKPEEPGKKTIVPWLFITLATLVIPTGLTTWAIAYTMAAVLYKVINDIPLFIGLVSLSAGIIGSSYPLVWGIFLYPMYKRWLEQSVPSSESVGTSSTTTDVSEEQRSEKEYQQ